MGVCGSVVWVVWMLLSIHLNRISGIPDIDQEAGFKDAFHEGLEDHDPHAGMFEVEKLLKAECLKIKKGDVEDYEKSLMVISGEMAEILYAVTVRIFQLWPEIKASQDPSVLYKDDIFKQLKTTYEAVEKEFLRVFPEVVLGRARRLQLQNKEWSKEDSSNVIARGTRWLLSSSFEGLIGIFFNVDKVSNLGESNCSH